MAAEPEEMPQDVALQLFHAGAFLVFKDSLPTGMEFGIDYKSWQVGPKFLGLKMIPPGLHFVYMSVKDAPRIGFFYNFRQKEVVVRKWDKAAEDLENYTSPEEEMDRLRANLQNIDKNLAAYPYSTYNQWVSLSNHVTEKTVKRLSPENALGKITSQTDLVSKEQEIEAQMGDPMGTSAVDRNHPSRIRFTDAIGLPVMSAKPGTSMRFSEVPQVSLADTNLKKAGIDSSDRFYTLLKSLGDNQKELLGEFQFSFVVFLIGQVYEGFEQWKRLIHLMCSCNRALVTHSQFFLDLLMVIHFQLKQCPEDFFHDQLAKDNFLWATLSLFFANVEDSDGASSELRSKTAKFKQLVEKRFNRIFDLPDE
ncbi:AAR2 protein [Ditylenchus destructor]|nr:AAR2 protein [Ditylenchus destructor]